MVLVSLLSTPLIKPDKILKSELLTARIAQHKHMPEGRSLPNLINLATEALEVIGLPVIWQEEFRKDLMILRRDGFTDLHEINNLLKKFFKMPKMVKAWMSSNDAVTQHGDNHSQIEDLANSLYGIFDEIHIKLLHDGALYVSSLTEAALFSVVDTWFRYCEVCEEEITEYETLLGKVNKMLNDYYGLRKVDKVSLLDQRDALKESGNSVASYLARVDSARNKCKKSSTDNDILKSIHHLFDVIEMISGSPQKDEIHRDEQVEQTELEMLVPRLINILKRAAFLGTEMRNAFPYEMPSLLAQHNLKLTLASIGFIGASTYLLGAGHETRTRAWGKVSGYSSLGGQQVLDVYKAVYSTLIGYGEAEPALVEEAPSKVGHAWEVLRNSLHARSHFKKVVSDFLSRDVKPMVDLAIGSGVFYFAGKKVWNAQQNNVQALTHEIDETLKQLSLLLVTYEADAKMNESDLGFFVYWTYKLRRLKETAPQEFHKLLAEVLGFLENESLSPDKKLKSIEICLRPYHVAAYQI